MNTLAGKTAVVTGAGRGIGQAIARLFAAEGAKVVLISRNPASCNGAADAINAEFPGSCKAYACDVADAAAVDECMKQVLADHPAVDILVNNAGITRDGLMLRMTEQAWDDVISVDLKAAFNTIQAVLPKMMRKKGGSIINISSIVGVNGNAGQCNYAAAKAGLIGMSKSLAKEMGGKGIRANCIAPGYILTEMTDFMSEEMRADYVSRIALKRAGQPEEVAQVALFLASDMSSYVTGQVIQCCGGM